MIPTRLVLRRFLCYREPVEVDFTGLYLACLSGENGAGKSALLDAITWALWEKARAENQHLVSLGESDTRVEFSFLLDGREYRVIRGYTSSGRSRSLLELHLRDGDEWRPVTSGGKQSVQREIDRILGLDYATFVNSVFLLQGKADEFTRRSPSERKRILSELLELDRYERYREVVRDEIRRLREERARLERELELLTERAAAVDGLRSRLAALERLAHSREDELRRLHERRTAWQERFQRLALEMERYRERQERLGTLRQEVRTLEEEHDRLRCEHTRLEQVLAREPDVLARRDERERLERTLAEIERTIAHRRTLQEKCGRLRAEYDARQQQLLATIRSHRTRLEDISREIAQRPHYEIERARLTHELEQLRERRAEYDRIERELATLRQRRDELNDVLQLIAAYESRLRELDAERRTLQEEAERLRRELERRPLLEAERQRIEEENARLDALRVERERIEHDLRTLRDRESELKASGKQLRQQLEELHQQVQQLERLDAVCPVCLRPLTAEERARQVAALRSRGSELRRQFDALGTEVQAIRAQIASLERELAGVEQRLRDSSAAQMQLGQITAELERLNQYAERLGELERSIQRLSDAVNNDAELIQTAERVRVYEQRLALFSVTADETLAPLQDRAASYRQAARELQERILSLEQARNDLDEELRAESDLQAQLGRITAELERLSSLECERAALERRLHELHHALETDADLLALRQELRTLEEELAQFPDLDGRAREIAERLQALAGVEDELRELDRVRISLRYLRQQLEQLDGRRQALRQELEGLEAGLASTAPPEEEFAAASREVEAVSAEIAQVESALRALQTELGAVRQQVHDAELAAEAARTLQEQLDRMAREQTVLDELDRAFGKHGIPTLILENVLPELADVANDILDRLPGNTLRIDFSTQQERATGDGAKETLDILISDEFGQRPYELYSGGEAFRINFALRVALSLLLAQRAGRRLQTLVIDEGFGTQDAKGREGLIRALQAVRDYFSLILVVTHLEDMKEQFPQRIEVTKTPNGSQVTVIA